MRWIHRFLWSALALLVALAAALWVYSLLVLPQQDGRLNMAGITGEVRIERDADGIPSIHAGNLADLMFGLGVVHAQDRLWQLETHKRIGSGRLAEGFGLGALETDRFLRALGVRRAAQAQWQQTKGESRAALSAYARGINSYVRNHMKARPPEFMILGLQPEDWSEVDSLAWGIMMAWDLGGNWGTELQRLRLALKMPVARVNELIPPYPGDSYPPTADYAQLFQGLNLRASTKSAWNRLQDIAPESGVEGVGSNNWVLAGSHTTTGKPLLANDPHLKLSAPALWYFVRLYAPGIKVAGASMPGLPTVVLGQNEHIAWGFTNTGPDVQDLYIERIKPDDPAQYQTPDGWAPFETSTEKIAVKGQPDVTIAVRRTRHGPVISDAGGHDDVLGAKGRPGYALAMRWTALDPDGDTVATGLAFNRATSVQTFVAASKGWIAPMQNMLVADREGRIGFVAPGRVPVRQPDNDLHGLVPAPGWEARYDWAGWVPVDETPREFDPARGYIATANQRIHGKDYPHYLTSDWALPYRQRRIEQMLQDRPRHSLDDLRAIQADEYSLAALKLLPYLKKASSPHKLALAAQDQLANFDGRMAVDKAAPLILWTWTRHLTQALFAENMGAEFYERTLASRTFRDALEGALERDDSHWCDNTTTRVVETCAMQADSAFSSALAELKFRFGDDVSKWQWGQAHQARSEHRPFSRVRGLASLFEARTPVGGDTFTVNVSRVSFRPDPVTSELYLDEHGPSLRALYDLADPAQSRVMHSTGQSGIALSPLYKRWVKPWAQAEYVPLWPAVPPEQVLTLVPL